MMVKSLILNGIIAAIALIGTVAASEFERDGFDRFKAQTKRFWQSKHEEGDLHWHQKMFDAFYNGKSIDTAVRVKKIDGQRDEDIESIMDLEILPNKKGFILSFGHSRYGTFTKEELARDFGFNKKKKNLFWSSKQLRDPKPGDVWDFSKSIMCGYTERKLQFVDEGDVIKNNANVVCRMYMPLSNTYMKMALKDEFEQFKQDQNK